MEVLVCLASRPGGEPASKEAILKIVWPDTFVTEDVLTRSISELRRVFQDDARQPKFIQTIPKRGYRLVAPLELASGNSSEATSAIRRPLLAKSLAAASALVLLVVLSLVILRENRWRNWWVKRFTTESSSARVESSIQDLPPDLSKGRPARVLPKLIKKPSATIVPANPEFKKPTQTTASEPSGPTVSPNVNTGTSSIAVQFPPTRMEARVQNIQPDVVRTRVTHAVLPIYPAYALQVHVTGTVEIGLGVSPNGDVGSARVLIGHPMLITPALEAIRQWRFQPNQVQGELTWSRMRALVRFRADGTTAVAFAPLLLADSFGDLGAQRDERSDASIPSVVPEAH